MATRKIALIGAMGSGKSTLARLYASATGCKAFDCDDEFTARYGDISAFFDSRGEREFREKESEILIAAAMSDARVIATGGGAVMCRRGMNALRMTCDIVHLTAPTETLRARISHSDRPLKSALEQTVSDRAPLYEKYADYTVCTDTDSAQISLAALSGALREKRPNRYDIVLCDADDTVLDFGTAMKYSLIRAVRASGLKSADARIVSEYSKVNDEVWGRLERGEITRSELDDMRFRMLLERLDEVGDAAALNDRYISEMIKTRFVLDGAKEFLSELKRRGINTYIITNSFYRIASERLKALDGYIDGAFISETCSFDKPDPRFFEYVFAELGISDKSRVAVFGDSPTSDIAGAAAFGLDCCLYKPAGKDVSRADFVAEDYSEFLSVL